MFWIWICKENRSHIQEIFALSSRDCTYYTLLQREVFDSRRVRGPVQGLPSEEARRNGLFRLADFIISLLLALHSAELANGLQTQTRDILR